MGMKPRQTPLTNIDYATRVAAKADANKRVLRRAPTILENAARILLSNALIEARKSHRIVQGPCTHDGANHAHKTCCVLCALALYRGEKVMGDEEVAARLLALPAEWVLDMISGFDHDHEEVVFPVAKSIGARLWRKYGPRS